MRRAELRYRLLFEQAPVMYVITGNEHGAPIITDCNELFLTTLGYDSRADVLGRPLGDFYAPPSRAELLEHGGFQRALEGRFVAEERQLVTRDGRLVETMLRAVPELDADGRTIGTRAMYVDITERKGAEQALRESEERFRLIAGTTSDVIWDSDLTTGRVWRSEGMQRLFGYGPGQEDPRMMWWSERIHPEDRERVVSGIYGAITGGGESWFGEYRFRRADGSYAYVHDRSYVIRDGDGRPVRLIGGITDISERKRAEEALEQSERRYRSWPERDGDHVDDECSFVSVMESGRGAHLRLEGRRSHGRLAWEVFRSEFSGWPRRGLRGNSLAASELRAIRTLFENGRFHGELDPIPARTARKSRSKQEALH